MFKLPKIGRPYRPWFIIGDNNGEIPLQRQLCGLTTIDVAGKSVLDVGCAEGLISLHMHQRGASPVHGIEIRERAVEVALSLAGFAGVSDQVKFYQGDLLEPDVALNQDGMLEQYDVIFAMASLQKVKSKSAALVRNLAGRCKQTFVIRLPYKELDDEASKKVNPIDLMTDEGFELERESCGHPQGDPPYPMEGGSWLAVFHRAK